MSAHEDRLRLIRKQRMEQFFREMEELQITDLQERIDDVSARIIPMEGTLVPYFIVQVSGHFDKTRLTKASAERTARRLIEKRRRELKAELRSLVNTEEIR